MSRAEHVMGWCFPWIFRRPRKKLNQREREKKKNEGGGNEQNKAIEISSLASGLV